MGTIVEVTDNGEYVVELDGGRTLTFYRHELSRALNYG
jgi:hypothetical protein